MGNSKIVTMNGIAVAKMNAGKCSVWVIVGGTDGKHRQVSYDGNSFSTNVWKNGKTYGATNRCDTLNVKIYGKEFAAILGEELRAYFFEACALEWKVRLEKIQADYDAKGYGLVPQPEKLAEVNEYLAAKAAQERKTVLLYDGYGATRYTVVTKEELPNDAKYEHTEEGYNCYVVHNEAEVSFYAVKEA